MSSVFVSVGKLGVVKIVDVISSPAVTHRRYSVR